MCWKKKTKTAKITDTETTITTPSCLIEKEDGIEFVEAYQVNGVWTTAKHFCPNDEIVRISEDGTIIELRYEEEENSNFDPLEQKEDYETYKNLGIRTLELKRDLYIGWSLVSQIVDAYVETNKAQTCHRLVSSIEPFEKFMDEGSKYKLIDSEREFLEYLNSPYDSNMFCDLKLYRTLKGFGLNADEIQKKAIWVGYDLRRYKKLVEIMEESKDDKELFEFLYKRISEERCVTYALAQAPCYV